MNFILWAMFWASLVPGMLLFVLTLAASSPPTDSASLRDGARTFTLMYIAAALFAIAARIG